jgi:hypothetical protein
MSALKPIPSGVELLAPTLRLTKAKTVSLELGSAPTLYRSDRNNAE